MMHNFISLGKAKALGYNDIYFSFSGLGDNLIFRSALEHYYRQTGQKLLVIVDYPAFFQDFEAAYILKDFNMGVLNPMAPFKNDELVVEGMSFKLHFLNGCAIRETEDGHYFTAWANKHLIARLCERLGLNGSITIDPVLPLTDEEKKFGRFFEQNQIAIIANGIQKYKTWDLNKVPGGSSGGSAAAVAGFEATLALGSDTGGSIRLPASFCGIVGMKPTYGRVSRYGLIAFASSLDQIGPFARNVEDTALLLEAISGHDPHDSTSLNLPVPAFSKALNKDIKGSKVGVIKELLAEGVSEDVKKAVEKAVETYKSLGAEIVEISLPLLEHSIGVYYILATAEASSNLARFDGVKYGHRTKDAKNLLEMYTKTRAEGFGDEVKRRIMLGTYALSAGYYDAYYKKAQQIRRLIKEDFDKAFEKADILISPTCPNTAFEIGSKISDPLSMYLTDIGTISANLAGVPGMSLPCGLDRNGMPIGLQILAPVLGEEKLFNMAYNFEQATDFHNLKPAI